MYRPSYKLDDIILALYMINVNRLRNKKVKYAFFLRAFAHIVKKRSNNHAKKVTVCRFYQSLKNIFEKWIDILERKEYNRIGIL